MSCRWMMGTWSDRIRPRKPANFSAASETAFCRSGLLFTRSYCRSFVRTATLATGSLLFGYGSSLGHELALGRALRITEEAPREPPALGAPALGPHRHLQRASARFDVVHAPYDLHRLPLPAAGAAVLLSRADILREDEARIAQSAGVEERDDAHLSVGQAPVGRRVPDHDLYPWRHVLVVELALGQDAVELHHVVHVADRPLLFELEPRADDLPELGVVDRLA